MLKAYKYRLFPNDVQAEGIRRTIGCCRFVFNRFLAERQRLYQEQSVTMGYHACSAALTKLKTDLSWLKEVDATALQSSLSDLDEAYHQFFSARKKGKKVGYPRFKSKHTARKSYTSKNNKGTVDISSRAVKLPKLGWVKAAVSKQIEGRILSATVCFAPSGRYYVSLLCTDVEMEHLSKTGTVVGIDLGIKSLAVTSDGKIYDNNKHLSKSLKKLAREQRRLSRKQKGSRNRDKQRVRVARVHEHIANQRMDTIHKMTTQLVRDYDIICMEDLAVKNILKNHKLARAISDAAWGEIERQLGYKTQWYGKALVHTGRFYASSQLCACGYKNPEVKDLSVRFWECPICGREHDRDLNAARNILSEGLRSFAASMP